MGKLIKMDIYRLFQSKLFWILCAVTFGIEMIISFGLPFLLDMVKNFSDNPDSNNITNDVSFSSLVSEPITGLLLIVMFASVTAFLFADIRNGYIKNIAGQLPKKGHTVVSKFVASIIHNFIFMLFGFLGSFIGNLLCPKTTIFFDNKILSALVVVVLNLILSMAMVSIILFLTTGLRNKTLASIVSVLFSVSALSLLYMGINKLLEVVGLKEFDIGNYMPDQLYGQKFDLAAVNSVISAALVGIAFCAVFLFLTVAIVNKRDVK